MKKIVLTGGGTAGHVTPNIALMPRLKEEGFEIHYIGSHEGMERKMIESLNVAYYPISSGKLRRYLDFKNITDLFRVVKGLGDAVNVLRKIKPDIVFSKGGFVAVPVALGAKLCSIPVVVHESDVTPGLANKLATPFAKKVCVTFPETLNYIAKDKALLTGSPIRKEILSGKSARGFQTLFLTNNKPVVLVIGGSSGSLKINGAVRKLLPKLLFDFHVVHICGSGNIDNSLLDLDGYKQLEFVTESLGDIFAMADIIVSRAGSNSISEFLALKKPNLLIPLSQKASRGDQILNAKSFEKQGFSLVLEDESLNSDSLYENITTLYKNKSKYIENMAKDQRTDGITNVMQVIREYAR